MLNTILAALAFISFAITFWRWVVSARFPLHRRVSVQINPPGVTVLKPLKGCDSESERCLRAWLAQEYSGPVQFLFGVASKDDPVCDLVRQLIAEFPKKEAQLVICEQILGANAKVSKLRQLEPLISHPLVVVSDADTAPQPDLLVNLAPQLQDPDVGMVSCFYRLANPGNIAMQWEAICINTDFWTQVLQAKSLSEVDFAMGAVMALSVKQLRTIGGFSALADFLADDFQLGNRVRLAGKRVEFSTVVVDCWDAPVGWGAVWKHQLRWARTMRICKPAPFFFSILENATLWPFLWICASLLRVLTVSSAGVDATLAANSMRFSLFSCLFFLGMRIATALHQQSRMNQGNARFAYGLFAPVKDLLNATVWASAFWGNRIEWRGERYLIVSGGKLERIAA